MSFQAAFLLPHNLALPEMPGVFELKLPQKMDDDEFFEFCVANPDLHIEQDAHGKLYIMAPVGFDSGNYEAEISGELRNWRKAAKKGKTPSPSTAFKLPDGSTFSPDSSWISEEKVSQLTADQRKKFAPVVPDFVVEIRSESDRISRLKKKMENVWMKNGVRLGWLIDPLKEKVYIYRQGQTVEIVPDFKHVLSGEDVCVGFEFDLKMLKEV